jgi:hypothetical protein
VTAVKSSNLTRQQPAFVETCLELAYWTRLVVDMLVVLDKLRSRDLAVKLTAMLLVFFFFQQMMPRKARRSSLDEQAYMKGLMQLLK